MPGIPRKVCSVQLRQVVNREITIKIKYFIFRPKFQQKKINSETLFVCASVRFLLFPKGTPME